MPRLPEFIYLFEQSWYRTVVLAWPLIGLVPLCLLLILGFNAKTLLIAPKLFTLSFLILFCWTVQAIILLPYIWWEKFIRPLDKAGVIRIYGVNAVIITLHHLSSIACGIALSVLGRHFMKYAIYAVIIPGAFGIFPVLFLGLALESAFAGRDPFHPPPPVDDFPRYGRYTFPRWGEKCAACRNRFRWDEIVLRYSPCDCAKHHFCKENVHLPYYACNNLLHAPTRSHTPPPPLHLMHTCNDFDIKGTRIGPQSLSATIPPVLSLMPSASPPFPFRPPLLAFSDVAPLLSVAPESIFPSSLSSASYPTLSVFSSPSSSSSSSLSSSSSSSFPSSFSSSSSSFSSSSFSSSSFSSHPHSYSSLSHPYSHSPHSHSSHLHSPPLPTSPCSFVAPDTLSSHPTSAFYSSNHLVFAANAPLPPSHNPSSSSLPLIVQPSSKARKEENEEKVHISSDEKKWEERELVV